MFLRLNGNNSRTYGVLLKKATVFAGSRGEDDEISAIETRINDSRNQQEVRRVQVRMVISKIVTTSFHHRTAAFAQAQKKIFMEAISSAEDVLLRDDHKFQETIGSLQNHLQMRQVNIFPNEPNPFATYSSSSNVFRTHFADSFPLR